MALVIALTQELEYIPAIITKMLELSVNVSSN